MKAFTATDLPPLFNEWMRRFTEEPERFQAEFKTVQLFLAERNAGKVPTYGDECVGMLDKLRAEGKAVERAEVAISADIAERAVEQIHAALTGKSQQHKPSSPSPSRRMAKGGRKTKSKQPKSRKRK